MEKTKFFNLETDIKSKIINRLLYSMPLAISLFDIQKRQNIFTNEQYYKGIGYTPDEFDPLDKDCFNRLVHPDDLPSLHKFLDVLTNSPNDGCHILVNRCICKNGEFKWFKNYITIVERESSGVPRLLLALAHDITSQIDSRQKSLEQINNMEKVSFTLSHELRHEHSKILSILDISKDSDMIEVGDLQWLANTIYTSAESIDKSIHSISQQLLSIKTKFIKLNSTEL